MKVLIKISAILLILIFNRCDTEYDYELNNTNWDIYINWFGVVYHEPNEITFFQDGTTSWGGTWYKTDRLTFAWEIDKRTYYACFKKDLSKIDGYCKNTTNQTGTFYGYKRAD